MAPVPPAGRLYTQLGPPGWSQQAGWVLPITAGTTPVTDPATGVTVAITPQDRSTPDTAGQRVGPRDRWLSVLEPDGRTRYAAPLEPRPVRPGDHPDRRHHGRVDRRPRPDPVPAADRRPGHHPRPPDRRELTATPGGSVLLTLPGDRVGYLHHGAVHTVQVLPRTSPAAALDGAVAGHPTGHRGLVDASATTPHPPRSPRPPRPAPAPCKPCWRSPPPGCC